MRERLELHLYSLVGVASVLRWTWWMSGNRPHLTCNMRKEGQHEEGGSTFVPSRFPAPGQRNLTHLLRCTDHIASLRHRPPPVRCTFLA